MTTFSIHSWFYKLILSTHEYGKPAVEKRAPPPVRLGRHLATHRGPASLAKQLTFLSLWKLQAMKIECIVYVYVYVYI